MKLTPEQIEEQRPIFENYITNTVGFGDWAIKRLGMHGKGDYCDTGMQYRFNIWLLSVESQPRREIRLPEFMIRDNDFCAGYNRALDDSKELIEKQGCTVI